MSDFWVFGYGSLMWRPGFAYRESRPARLAGAHRSLCVYSWVHRGTRQRPGLVLGLDLGGSCRGVAYRIDGADRQAVLAYLAERELITPVYRQVWRRIRVAGGARSVVALTYVVDRASPQYAGRLPRETLFDHVRASTGQSGRNADYVVNTAWHLRELGIRDATLEWLAAVLQRS